MESFVGELAGLLMIFLIITLFIKLLSDLLSPKIVSFFRENKKMIVAIFLLGVLQIMLGAMIVSFYRKNVTVFNYEKIWDIHFYEKNYPFLKEFSFEKLL